ncbi:MAG: ATP-binding protein [bacterium]
MKKEKSWKFYAGLVLTCVLVLSITFLQLSQRQRFFWINEPVHSSMGAFGAFISLIMCWIMLERRKTAAGGKFYLLAIGFMSMGVFDTFHAFSSLENDFVFLHNMAGLFGGFFFSLVWIPKVSNYVAKNTWLFWLIFTFSILLGLWTFFSPQTVPQMVCDGEFTNIAVVISFLGGVLFLAAALRFLLDFHLSSDRETYLFIYLALLFGLAELMSKYSLPWDSSWWLWHLWRLIAYVLVLTVLISRYQEMVSNLRIAVTTSEQQAVFLDNLFESIKFPLYVIDVNDYRIIKANSAGGAGKGVLSKDTTCYSLTHHSKTPCTGKCECPLQKAKEHKKPVEVEHLHYDKDGNLKLFFIVHAFPIFDAEGNVVQIIESNIDITERKKAEEKERELLAVKTTIDVERAKAAELKKAYDELKETQGRLICSEKLAIMGKWAGAIAHELRNPLGTIRNSVYFLKLKLAGATRDEKIKKHLDTLDEEVIISDKIIMDILSFARVKIPQLVLTDITEVIGTSLEKLKVTANIEVDKQLEPDLPQIQADKTQLQQVFSNIMVNAIQSMPGGGRLTISAKKVNEFVEIGFTDTGEGILKENMEKIFEPLFSTRIQGTGFGLTVCQSIVEAHRGNIIAESEAQKGTKFTVKLPIKRKSAFLHFTKSQK